MGDNKSNQSRRSFLSKMFSATPLAENPEMVKMLTADGKLVEVKKSVVDAAATREKATNEKILHWMVNPSKENL